MKTFVKQNWSFLLIILVGAGSFPIFRYLASRSVPGSYTTLLATYTAVLASIFAIVFAISLVAVQHAANRYSSLILELYRKNFRTISTYVVYIGSILYGFMALISPIGAIGVSIAGTLFTVCLLLVWVNFVSVVSFVNPIKLLDDLENQAKRRMTKSKIEIEEIDEIVNSVGAMAIKALEQVDQETASKCIGSLERICRFPPKHDDDQKIVRQFCAFEILYALHSIGNYAVKRQESFMVKKVIGSMRAVTSCCEATLFDMAIRVQSLFTSLQPLDIDVGVCSIGTFVKKYKHNELVPSVVRVMSGIVEELIHARTKNWRLIVDEKYSPGLIAAFERLVRIQGGDYDQEMAHIITPNLIGIAGCIMNQDSSGENSDLLDGLCKKIIRYNFWPLGATEKLRRIPSQFEEALKLFPDYSTEIGKFRDQLSDEVSKDQLKLQHPMEGIVGEAIPQTPLPCTGCYGFSQWGWPTTS